MTTAQPPVALPPGYELKRKKHFWQRVWFWLLAVSLVIVVVIVVAVASAVDKVTNNPHTVVYKITGTVKTATIDYYSSDGSGKSVSEQADKQQLPWTKTIEVKGDFSGFTLSASPTDIMDQGNLACEIVVDGKTVSTGEASAPDVVSCHGSGA